MGQLPSVVLSLAALGAHEANEDVWDRGLVGDVLAAGVHPGLADVAGDHALAVVVLGATGAGYQPVLDAACREVVSQVANATVGIRGRIVRGR